jgi:hypothetical protein
MFEISKLTGNDRNREQELEKVTLLNHGSAILVNHLH